MGLIGLMIFLIDADELILDGALEAFLAELVFCVDAFFASRARIFLFGDWLAGDDDSDDHRRPCRYGEPEREAKWFFRHE